MKNTEKRDFKGVWIPKEIWLNKKLTLLEKVFLVEIDSLDNNDGCYASNKHFAEFFNLSKNRCSEIIKSLNQKDFITIKLIRKDKQIIKRIIKINPIRKIDYPIRKTGIPLFGKLGYPYSENRKESNTSNNNTYINNTEGFSDKSIINRIGKTQYTSLVKIVNNKIAGYELFKNEKYFKVFLEWLEWKKEEGKAYKGTMGIKKILKGSLVVGIEQAIKDIETATCKWQGIFFNTKDKQIKEPENSFYDNFN